MSLIPGRALGLGAGFLLLLALATRSAEQSPVLAVPANDDFAGAITIITPAVSGIVTTGTAADATTETGEPVSHGAIAECNGQATGTYAATLWYNWTAPETKTYVLDTYGSDIETVLAIYTGSAVDGLTLVKCSRDFPTGGGNDSAFAVAAIQGVTYRVQLGSVGGGGNFVLSMSLGAEMFVTGRTPTTNDSNSSDGFLTLREAMLLARGGTGAAGLNRAPSSGESSAILNIGAAGVSSPDVVRFAPSFFTGGGTSISSALPALDGTGDVVSGLGIEVTVNAAAASLDCFTVSGNDNRIEGLQVVSCAVGVVISGDGNTIGGAMLPGQRNRFSINTVGVRIDGGGSGNKVIGNTIGVPDNGLGSLANDTGVVIVGDNNTIGGSGPGEGNQITGSASEGTVELVYIFGFSAFGNKVLGNRIGTNAAGTAQQNAFTSYSSAYGIRFDAGALNNEIGGSGAGEGNVISSSGSIGVAIGAGSTGNLIRGNKIGTDITGTSPLPNSVGVSIVNSPSNVVGGSGPGEGNVISGNAGRGVDVTGSGNVIRGNLIGTAADGTSALGNSDTGLIIRGAGSNDNLVGGTDPGQANIIAFNFADGVRVSAGTGNTIRGNSIHDNGLLGIENIGGGNGEPGHAPPLITAVGSASGTACANCTIDVYSDSGAEGEAWQGAVIADSGGNWTYFGPVLGPNVTATATNPAGSTSEFSVGVPCGDFDADTISNCSDSEDDGDGFTDEAEAGIALCRNATNDDSFDAETLFFVNDGCPAIGIRETNCGGALDNDSDGFPNDGCPADGLYSEAEFRIGTGSQDPCGNNGWPLDLVSTPASTENRYNISDLASFVTGVRKLGKNPDQAGFDSRWDLEPGNSGLTSSGWINIVDLGKTTGGASGFPPMLGGARALNQLCPFPP